MRNLFDILLNSFKTNFPNINWGLGSIVRTLLVNPMTKIGEAVDQVLRRVDGLSNLREALDDPTNNEETLDFWLDQLGIVTYQTKPATGVVTLLLSSDTPIDIPINTALEWDVDAVTLFTTEAVTSDGQGVNRISRLSNGLFSITVPVSTLEPSDILLSTDSRLNWREAPDTVLDIYVTSTIGGGTTYMDPQSKALLIQTKLDELSLVSSKGLTAVLVSRYAPLIVSAKIIKNTSNSRTGAMSVCLKQARPPVTTIAEYSPVTVASGVRQVVITQTGILAVKSVHDCLTGANVLFSVTEDGENTVITLNSEITGDRVRVETVNYQDIDQPLQWLVSENSMLPFSVTPVLPRCINIEINLTIKSGTVTDEVKSSLCKYVCNSQLNANISEQQIIDILNKFDITLTRPPFIVYRDIASGSELIHSSAGAINISELATNGSTPIAAYLTFDNIKVNNDSI